MKKKVDFLFIYENKNRELENICLLKYELERRGYTCRIVETWYRNHHYRQPINAEVVIVFAFYNDGQISVIQNFATNVEKVVNLQWEQLYTIADEITEGCLYYIKEKALKAVHISWGKQNYEFLTKKCGVKSDNMCLAGHVTMDFLKPQMQGYYRTKEELCREYGLDSTKRMYMFISSFSYVGLPDEEIESGVYEQVAFSALEMKKISIQSQVEILDWIRETLVLYPEIYFIYRPHPAEKENPRLLQLEREYINFKVIDDYSVKQWIVVCDKIYTWYSTSIAEVYMAKKTCSVLRPFTIPRNLDIRIYENCSCILEKKDFIDDYLNLETEFPIDVNILNHYYEFNEDKLSYMVVCDKLEDVYRSDSYKYKFWNEEKKSMMQLRHMWRFILTLKKRIKGILYNSCSKIRVIKSKEMEMAGYTEYMARKNNASKKEIIKITNHIKSVIEK